MNEKKTTTAMLGGLLIVATLALSLTGYGYADLATEKPQIMEKASEKMQMLAQKDKNEKLGIKYSPEEYGIPYNMVFEDDGKMVVGIDAHKAIEFEKRYTEDEVKKDLETKANVEVRYYVFEPEADVWGGDARGDQIFGASIQTITLVRDDKIITSDHLDTESGDLVYAGPRGSVDCRELRIVYVQPKGERTSDAAYGRDTVRRDCDHNYVENSIKYMGNVYSVIDGTASDIRRHLVVHAAGAVTGGSTGRIIADGATVRGDGITLTKQVLANYVSTPGDSGAPVFVMAGHGSAKIIGQHVGKMCEIYRIDGYGDRSVRFCEPGHQNGIVRIFSPWPEVKNSLGI